MPAIRDVVAPKGAGGAVLGFGVPLTDSNDKSLLEIPMGRGIYALASPDRKTVMRLRVLSKEEAGFDPEAIVSSAMALTLSQEAMARLRGTWLLGQLTFESHDPDVAPSMDFVLDVCVRLAELSEGVVADPLSQRYRLPQDLRTLDRPEGAVDAREHVSMNRRPMSGAEQAFTLGMRKFGLPEIEMNGLLEDEMRLAHQYLMQLCQRILKDGPVSPGDSFGPFQLAEGGFDRAQWEGIPVLEALPPTRSTAGETLRSIAVPL
ncbi:hypothetical protein EON81_06035 [bacterium]|nr:MAG: hypothetical protein EON81_06035 [bacterium]